MQEKGVKFLGVVGAESSREREEEFGVQFLICFCEFFFKY